MKKQVLAYVKPASELKAGDRILTNRMTVAEVNAVEAIDNGAAMDQRIMDVRLNGPFAPSIMFRADEQVLVIE